MKRLASFSYGLTLALVFTMVTLFPTMVSAKAKTTECRMDKMTVVFSFGEDTEDQVMSFTEDDFRMDTENEDGIRRVATCDIPFYYSKMVFSMTLVDADGETIVTEGSDAKYFGDFKYKLKSLSLEKGGPSSEREGAITSEDFGMTFSREFPDQSSKIVCYAETFSLWFSQSDTGKNDKIYDIPYVIEFSRTLPSIEEVKFPSQPSNIQPEYTLTDDGVLVDCSAFGEETGEFEIQVIFDEKSDFIYEIYDQDDNICDSNTLTFVRGKTLNYTVRLKNEGFEYSKKYPILVDAIEYTTFDLIELTFIDTKGEQQEETETVGYDTFIEDGMTHPMLVPNGYDKVRIDVIAFSDVAEISFDSDVRLEKSVANEFGISEKEVPIDIRIQYGEKEEAYQIIFFTNEKTFEKYVEKNMLGDTDKGKDGEYPNLTFWLIVVGVANIIFICLLGLFYISYKEKGA